MTYLRVFVRAVFLLAVIGAWSFAPLGPSPVLAADEKVDLLDLNTATAEQLKALPGMARPTQRRS